MASGDWGHSGFFFAKKPVAFGFCVASAAWTARGIETRFETELLRCARDPAGAVAVNSLPGGTGRQKGVLRGSLLPGTRCQES
jgi:hypothetical protein